MWVDASPGVLQILTIVRAHKHMQHVRYRYNARTKQCFKYVLNETFRPYEIPFGAKFVDRVEIGSNAVSGAGVEVDIWEGTAVGKSLSLSLSLSSSSLALYPSLSLA